MMQPLATRLPGAACRSSVISLVSSRSSHCLLRYQRVLPSAQQTAQRPSRHASSRVSTPGTNKFGAPLTGYQRSDGSKTPSGFIHSQELSSIRGQADFILSYPGIPSEQEILKPLKAIESATRSITGSPSAEPDDPASALLSINSEPKPSRLKSSVETVNALSTLSYRILTHPNIFVTPDILATYVRIQSLLQKPATFPEIFHLYANKPIPRGSRRRPGTGAPHITYKEAKEHAVSAAIPNSVAVRALNAAVASKDLQLTLDIIETTFGAPAFRREKLFRRALPVIGVGALSPVAAWQVASEMSSWQVSLAPEEFTAYAFAGIVAYLGGVGMLGYVAMTTANDQMQRVTWALGMPLWERWVREQERAACDLVALAFGFPEKSRWGAETGTDWNEFREFLGMRGMVLDKVSLMEGME